MKKQQLIITHRQNQWHCQKANGEQMLSSLAELPLTIAQRGELIVRLSAAEVTVITQKLPIADEETTTILIARLLEQLEGADALCYFDYHIIKEDQQQLVSIIYVAEKYLSNILNDLPKRAKVSRLTSSYELWQPDGDYQAALVMVLEAKQLSAVVYRHGKLFFAQQFPSPPSAEHIFQIYQKINGALNRQYDWLVFDGWFLFAYDILTPDDTQLWCQQLSYFTNALWQPLIPATTIRENNLKYRSSQKKQSPFPLTTLATKNKLTFAALILLTLLWANSELKLQAAIQQVTSLPSPDVIVPQKTPQLYGKAINDILSQTQNVVITEIASSAQGLTIYGYSENLEQIAAFSEYLKKEGGFKQITIQYIEQAVTISNRSSQKRLDFMATVF